MGQLTKAFASALRLSSRMTALGVINKPNGGGSSARNVGLDVATGHHIGFVDSDDWVEPGMYEAMYRRVSETDADVCICKTT